MIHLLFCSETTNADIKPEFQQQSKSQKVLLQNTLSLNFLGIKWNKLGMFSFQSQPDVCIKHYVSNICTEYFIQNKLELLHICKEKSQWFLNIQK